MEPAGKQVSAGIFSMSDDDTSHLNPFQQRVAEAVNAAIPLIWEEGIEAAIHSGLMETAEGSLGIFNALSYLLADHMATHSCQAVLTAEQLAEWKDKALEAFDNTLRIRLEIRRAEFAVAMKGKLS